jgi:hypothetical protein
MTRPPQKADDSGHSGSRMNFGASPQYDTGLESFQKNVRYRTYAFSYDLVPISERSSQHPHNPLGHSVAIHRTAPTSCNAANIANPNSAHRASAFMRSMGSSYSLRRTPASARNTKALAGSPSLQRSGEQSSCTALYRIGFEKHARSNARSRRAMHDCADRPLALFVKHFGRSKPQRNLRRLSAVQCGQPLTRFQASANRQPNHSRSSSK